MSKHKAWIMLTLANLFWAGNYVFGSYVVAEVPPIWITFIRWIFGSILLMAVAYFLEKPDFKKALKSWPILMIHGAVGLMGYNALVYSALEYTSSMNAALVNSLNPALIVFASVFLLREKISKYQTTGIFISLIGVMVILTNGNLGQVFTSSYNRGDLIMIGAIVLWTIYAIMGKRVSGIPPITATSISATFATLLMAPFAFAQGNYFVGLSPVAIGGLAYMIIFPSVLSFIFWNIPIREIGASKAGIFLNLNPVFTAIISWTLGEKIVGSQIYGGIFVFLGVLLTTGFLDDNMKNRLKRKLDTE